MLALRTPPRQRLEPPADPPSLPRRIRGKLWGYVARLEYPPRHFHLGAMVAEAERRYLPPAPALDTVPGYCEYAVPRINGPETASLIQSLGLDVLVPSTGIVKEPLLSAAPLGCLNAHHGWLPAIRGMWSPLHAIAENRPDWIGVTVHRMDAGIDTGPILARVRPEFSKEDTHETLWVRLDLAAADLLCEVVARLAAGSFPPSPNPPTEGVYRSRGSFFDHLRFELNHRRFFRRHGSAACAPLAPARTD